MVRTMDTARLIAAPHGLDVTAVDGLDLHVPDGPGPFPAAILVHGGGFDEGSKSTNVRPLFDELVRRDGRLYLVESRAYIGGAVADVVGARLQRLAGRLGDQLDGYAGNQRKREQDIQRQTT